MSKIQWTDVTDNPIIVKGGGWYCTKVSEGCQNCYAEVINGSSYYGGNGLKYSHLKDQPELELRRDLLASWARQRKPKKHFVASMTDVFGEFVPGGWIFELLDAMAAAPLQTFQVLTKRAERAKTTIRQWLKVRSLRELPPNIWLGVSVENQKRADERIPELIQIPAAVRFLSCEPLLGPLNISPWLIGNWVEYREHIHWVIIGGESGPKARPFNIWWAADIVGQCRKVEVPVFVKQLGSNPQFIAPTESSPVVCKDPKGGDPGEWPEWLRVREFPTIQATAELAQESLF